MAEDDDGPVVQTAQGPIRGMVKNDVYEFLGILYAAPAVGDLRWMPPVAHAPWTTVLQTTSFGSNCPQNNELGVFAGPVNITDEDCLFLNVFAPKFDRSASL
jgi:para-nitrobenzyl esterase